MDIVKRDDTRTAICPSVFNVHRDDLDPAHLLLTLNLHFISSAKFQRGSANFWFTICRRDRIPSFNSLQDCPPWEFSTDSLPHAVLRIFLVSPHGPLLAWKWSGLRIFYWVAFISILSCCWVWVDENIHGNDKVKILRKGFVHINSIQFSELMQRWRLCLQKCQCMGWCFFFF